MFPSKQLAMADRLDEVNASYENESKSVENISNEVEAETKESLKEKHENDRKIFDIKKYLTE